MGWVAMLGFKRTLICSAALLAGATMTAMAADLPGPPPAYPPPQAPAAYIPVAPAFSWTGFYLGGNAGYGWSSGSGNMILGLGADTFNVSGNGFLGGGQVGFNYQWSNIVFGIEGDFQGTTGKGTLTNGGGALAAGALNATAKDPWFGTVRGRLGYAWDRVMLYATGGLVYGDATLNGISGPAAFNNSTTYITWTAGGGVEAAFWGPWSGKIEYLYAGSPSSVPAIPFVTNISGKSSTNLVRAGLNYHF
jgi:outer membrane immunogenic protein